MTPEQQAALRAAIHANPACADALARRDCAALADLVPRTRANTREIGTGTVLDVLGMDSGNAFLDVVMSNQKFRYVKPLLEQGRLLIGSALVQATVRSMAPLVITAAEAERICALGVEPNPYSIQEIADAVFNPDGTQK